ncbi:MAG: AAA family ATPase [Oscillospiraceae bacterium]|nr:AAA family ATPase [Oscillospiraceae bacterium]
MYLKALEIQGFKSFADKTTLTFEKDITAIVGPNGSGKSNIADAILWVMGEQRSKALRGSKMEDVIFGGTQIRGSMGFAQVSLIIDNSAHIFDSDKSEIMLTRRYYRSGESEYFINKESVRLKDINSLLMDTGLGRDGYSIIGQGTIADIISTKNADRREVFEEAAGISRYRYRKEEAERKLEKTEENLIRIKDKIEELELQVGPLKEQSEKAKKYLILRDELRVREISVWMETLEKLRSQSATVKQEYEQLSDELAAVRARLEGVYASSESISERMHRKDEETESARDRLSAAESRLAAAESEIAVLNANILSAQENISRINQDLEKQRGRIEEIRSEIEKNEERIRAIDALKNELEQKKTENANVLAGCRMKLNSREAASVQLNEKMNAAEVELRSLDARIRMITDMQREYEGYSKAVKTVMREAQRGSLSNIYGPVADLIRADDEVALAIETALGSAAQNIVVGSQNDGRHAIELLKWNDSGRATFLPIDTIRGTVMKDAPINDPGFVGIASELVNYDAQYEQIVLNLLGRTVIAESLSDAVRMSRKRGNKLRIVTLDGQLVHAGGSMTGGSIIRGSGLISRVNELEKLQKDRENRATEKETLTREFNSMRSAVETMRYQLEMALEDEAELKREETGLDAERRTVAAASEQFGILLAGITGDSELRNSAITASENQITAFRSRLEEKDTLRLNIRADIQKERDAIAAISEEKLQLEGRRTRADKEAQQLNSDIIDLERRASRAEQRKMAADMEEKQILDKLWDSYELSHSAAEQIRQPIENLQKENRAISELRRQISALGQPNIGAIEEYDRVNSRYEFLCEQRDDIEKAKKELTDIIRDITHDMEAIFVNQFRQINVCFQDTFRELFGGGKAALILEDEEHVLDCGIDIQVQPPGKALSRISLLSGGEMAFVAIALYFAILRVRPTPFCVMDEIEAALDEENVARFAQYLRRMADKTQFLVITHRRGTMEEADMLYGVTMQEKGVTTVIGLDLDAAKKTIEV